MNEEQFEAVMVNTTITLFLCENNGKEIERNYLWETFTNTACCVTAEDQTTKNRFKFLVLKNENDEYQGLML